MTLTKGIDDAGVIPLGGFTMKLSKTLCDACHVDMTAAECEKASNRKTRLEALVKDVGNYAIVAVIPYVEFVRRGEPGRCYGAPDLCDVCFAYGVSQAARVLRKYAEDLAIVGLTRELPKGGGENAG